MARKKKKSRVAKTTHQQNKTIAETQPIEKKGRVIESSFSKINLSESYISLTIGIIVVLFAAVLIITFLRQQNQFKYTHPTKEISSQKIEEIDKGAKTALQIHTVAQGEDLKIISQKYYGTTDYYMEIVKANNIQNPDIIEIGQQLKIPRIEGKAQPTDKITESSYTVKENEYLWDIAVKAYGDGFRWVDIAKANNLQFPDILPPGTVLKIPR